MTDLERDALDVRPTADEMLARIKSETPSARGRLRVYLGMAPGVGKTYAMPNEGRRRKQRGTDVVVGYVETYGRPDVGLGRATSGGDTGHLVVGGGRADVRVEARCR